MITLFRQRGAFVSAELIFHMVGERAREPGESCLINSGAGQIPPAWLFIRARTEGHGQD